MIAAGSVGLYLYQDRFSAQRQIQQLEQRNQILQQVVQRLTSEKRVAEVIVTDQKTVGGVTHTMLLFVEYARDGSPLPAKSFEIEGTKPIPPGETQVRMEFRISRSPSTPVRTCISRTRRTSISTL